VEKGQKGKRDKGQKGEGIAKVSRDRVAVDVWQLMCGI
jgi:hypothetical protein